ncbi:pilin, partial [Klebsiella pneumoniae]|nr:pilin [Klebsiella pneumoniae]
YWPGAASDVMGNYSGKYVSAITLQGAIGTTGTISVEARMKDANINSTITGLTLVLTSVDAKQWSCTSGTITFKHRPSSCR